MTDEQLAEMHRFLAEYHRRLAKEAVLDVVQQYHSDLERRRWDEAALIPRRRAIVNRLHYRERQNRDDGGPEGHRTGKSSAWLIPTSKKPTEEGVTEE